MSREAISILITAPLQLRSNCTAANFPGKNSRYAAPLNFRPKKNSGKIRETSKGSEFGISEKCCILEKSRKNLVKFGENSAKFWQKLRNFGKKQQKIQQFLTKILRLERPLNGLSFSYFRLFSGLFWPGPFSPFFDYGFQNGAKECIV